MVDCNDGINIDATQRDGTVAIDSVTMHQKAFCILDASPLYEAFHVEGGDLSIPFRDGSLAIPRRNKTVEVALPFVVDGKYDVNDATNTNVRAGLAANLFWLKSNILGRSGTPDGTRLVELLLPDADPGDEYTGYAHVTGWQFELKTKRLWQGVLDLSFPSGTFGS